MSFRAAVAGIALAFTIHACARRDPFPSVAPGDRDQHGVELAAMETLAQVFAGVPLLFDATVGPHGEPVPVRDSAWVDQLSTAAHARRVVRDSVVRCGKATRGVLGDTTIVDQDCMLTPGYRLAFLGAPQFTADTAIIAVEVMQADSSRWRVRSSSHYVQWYFVRAGARWRLRG